MKRIIFEPIINKEITIKAGYGGILKTTELTINPVIRKPTNMLITAILMRRVIL
jgi:hypothetical protein